MIKTAKELVAMAVKVATEYKTLYVNGAFGAPMTENNKARYINGYAYNQRADRKPKIQAASSNTFGFDCICFIKGLLWDWEGDPNRVYGGADYAINGVPDIAENAMLNACSGVSDSFESLYIGEFLWMDGHCGLYIGDGLAVECTPIWADGVQITAVGNMGTKDGYQTRTWVKHGKLPYVTYEATPEEKPVQEPVTQPESEDLYLVWTGAFTSREEAEAFARELAAAGPFTPVISTVKEIPEGDVLPDPEPEAEAIQEGDAVYIRPGATDYNGGGLWEGVYGRVSQAFQIRGDRVVVTYNGVTVAAVNIKDLIKA